MKKLAIILLVISAGGIVYACNTYPIGWARLQAHAGRNTASFARAIGTVRQDGEYRLDRIAESLKKLAGDAGHDLLHIAAPATPEAPEPSDTQSVAEQPAPSSAPVPASTAPAAPEWKAPAKFPAQPNWNWTVPGSGSYQNVKVIGMERDSVVIVYTGGGTRVSVAQLPAPLQMELGYEPSAAALAQSSASSTSSWITEDYQQGVTQAILRRKKLLLFFTGSTWCPTCMGFESDILPTDSFQSAGASEYVMVKIEVPHSTSSDAPVNPNQVMANRYKVIGVPTFVACTTDGKEVGRFVGGFLRGEAHPDLFTNYLFSSLDGHPNGQ